MKKRWLATMLGLALFWQQCGSLALASEVTEPVVIQQEADVTAEENEAQQEKNQEAGFSEEDSEEEENLEEKVPESQDSSVEDEKVPETGEALEEEASQNIPAEGISSEIEAQNGEMDYMELDPDFDGSSFMYGEPITIPYTAYLDENDNHYFGITIYNSEKEFVADYLTSGRDEDFTDGNIFYFTAKFAPGIYYVQPYIYADEMQTSLDKGTQRKTTENELPSLTQCTA